MKIANSLVDEFDKFSVNYTEDMMRCVPYYQTLLSSFVTTLPSGFRPKRVLDLGCGNGNVTAQLLQTFPESYFELLDASLEMIDLCKNRFEGYNINYYTTFFNDFEFSDNTYDMVVAGFSLHHCEAADKQTLYKKIYTSLKPGGVFGYTDLMIDRTKPEHETLLQDWKHFVLQNYPDEDKWEWLMEHYAAYDQPESLETILPWLKDAGFMNIEPFIHDRYWVYVKAIK
ncbi:MAG: class I SAM-dependent methyltransferase [Flavobacteriaceae bacterium]|nr:class I SAM-dependent methyltransferase [Flavobacteriaceae bacterium]